MSTKWNSCYFLAILCLCFTTMIRSQSLASFVPKNYAILDTSFGDFNTDGKLDALMVLKVKGEKDTSNADRPLFILEGISNDKYKLAGRNDHIVFCASCGGAMGDPYQALIVDKNTFSVLLYGGSAWRWTQTITFAYEADKHKYILQSDKGESFNSTDPNKVKKIKNQKDKWGKVSFEEYSNDLD